MKTEATQPFGLVIKPGAKYHEPLAQYDGMPLASIVHDATNRLFFGIAVYAEDWDWPLCLVPITQEDVVRLETPDADWPNNTSVLYIELLSRCDGYYLWEMLGQLPKGQERVEFFDGSVPKDYMPTV